MGGIGNRCWRWIKYSLWLLSVLGTAGSCTSQLLREEGYATPCYGIPSVNLPLGAVDYQPPSPVHAGTVLTFTAELPQGEMLEAAVSVGTTELGWHTAQLLDDGSFPDQTAGDRVFTGQLQWQATDGTGKLIVCLNASGTIQGQPAYGSKQYPELKVLP
jgi:hypothetical protein